MPDLNHPHESVAGRVTLGIAFGLSAILGVLAVSKGSPILGVGLFIAAGSGIYFLIDE